MFALAAVLSLAASATAQDDVADVPSTRVTLPSQQVYYLIGDLTPKRDPGPRSILLVLPGGDGGQSFNPFVRRIYQNALPDGFVVAELVAPRAAAKNPIVWPTTKTPATARVVATETFIADVVEDASKRTKIDPDRVMALGWSSSGPALYTAAATMDFPVKKFFIAMSVFHPGDLPKPDAVNGKKVYILHSPDDRVCPIRMAEQAKDKLDTLGAHTTLAEYDGGHGWHGDVFGNIRLGVQWLLSTDAQSPPTR